MPRNRSGGLFVLPNGIEMPSLVKSVQRGTIALNATSVTATIVAVNLSNALVFASYQDLGGVNAADRNAVRVELTNTTTVTAFYGAVSGNSANVSWEVIEFMPGLFRSIQRGTATTGAGTTTTATITAVNMAKTFVHNLGFTSTSTTLLNLGATSSRWVVTNATTLTFDTGGATDATAGFQSVEFF